jgi:putative ABC transport system permease protein
VPLLGTIFPKTDGSAWEFHVAGVYRSEASTVDQATLFFHYDYLRESLESGVAEGPVGVGVYVLKLKTGASPTRVMADVDLLFENGPQRVQTTTEAEFSRQFVSMLGNVPTLLGSIGGAVLFAIFFAALNTMLMAARERLHAVGVLKALGFTDRAILLGFVAESLALCGAGGAVGVGLAKLVEPAAARALSGQLQAFALDPGVVSLALGLALLVGLVAGVVPGWRLARLSPVAALRAEA